MLDNIILLQSLIWKCQKLVDYQIRVADKFPKILIMECDFLIYFKLRNYVQQRSWMERNVWQCIIENLNAEDKVFIFIH